MKRTMLKTMLLGKLRVAAVSVLVPGLLFGAAWTLAGLGLGAAQAESHNPQGAAAVQADLPSTDATEKASATRPRTDLFGDPLPPGALVRMGTVRYAQGDSTYGYPELAPDHKTFVTVSNHTPYGSGRVVCLWDAATGKELRHLQDPVFDYYHAFFLKREPLLVTIGVSRKPIRGDTYAYAMHFWDPVTWKKMPRQIQATDYHFEPWAISSDEKWLACAGRNPPVVVRELKTGQQLATWHEVESRIQGLAFSADGKMLAISCDKAIHLWDWREKRQIRRLSGFPEDVVSLQFSSDGKWLTGAIYNEGLRVWETAGLTEVRRLKDGVRFFPDSKKVIATATGVIRDIASAKEVGRFENCKDCQTLEFSADGKTATGYAHGRIRRWDAASGKDLTPPYPAVNRMMIHQIGFLPDGQTAVSGSPDGGVHLWDAATGTLRRTLVAGTVWDGWHFLRVAADGTIIVVRNKRLSFFKNDKALAEIELTDFPEKALASINISADGKYLVLAGRLIQVWDVSSRKPLASFPTPEDARVETVAIAGNGRHIAASVGHGVCLLDARTGAVGRTLAERPPPPPRKDGELGHDGSGFAYFHGVQALSFSPDGELLACSGHPDGTVQLVDVFHGRKRHVLASPPHFKSNHYQLHNVVFSPDGRMVAVEHEWSGVIDIFETASGQRRRRFRGHRSYQTALAFSPDGSKLASGNRDATILIWDVFGRVTHPPPNLEPPTPAELDALWTRLMDADAERACLAMGRLLRVPEVSAPFLRQRLLGRKSSEAARLKNWLADLDSEQFHRRDKAAQELARHLASAEPILKEALAGNPSLEVRRRIEALLRKLQFKPPCLEVLRDLRALEVLEHIGGKSVEEVMREIAEGTYHPCLAAAAKAARQRLRWVSLALD